MVSRAKELFRRVPRDETFETEKREISMRGRLEGIKWAQFEPFDPGSV
jgi:hypothetical protein